MTVNPAKEKKLSNMRAANNDRNILLKPPREMTLEMALEYIEEDELVEVTPTKIRMRKAGVGGHRSPPPARKGVVTGRVMMNRMVLKSTVNSDGILRLAVSRGSDAANNEVQVTVEPVPPEAISTDEWRKLIP